MPRELRLRKRRDFLRIQGGGVRVRSRDLVVLWGPSDLEVPRFGLVVSRRVGNAVIRNRVKRWLREAIRRQHGGLPARDIVLIARPSAASAGYEALYDQVGRALRSITEAPAG